MKFNPSLPLTWTGSFNRAGHELRYHLVARVNVGPPGLPATRVYAACGATPFGLTGYMRDDAGPSRTPSLGLRCRRCEAAAVLLRPK